MFRFDFPVYPDAPAPQAGAFMIPSVQYPAAHTCRRCGHEIVEVAPIMEIEAQFDAYGQVMDHAPPVQVFYHKSCQVNYEGQIGQARTPWNPHGSPTNTMGMARTPMSADRQAQGSEGRMGAARTPWNR